MSVYLNRRTQFFFVCACAVSFTRWHHLFFHYHSCLLRYALATFFPNLMVSAAVACAFNFSLGFFFIFVCCCRFTVVFFCVAILFYCHWSLPQISFDMLPTIMVTHPPFLVYLLKFYSAYFFVCSFCIFSRCLYVYAVWVWRAHSFVCFVFFFILFYGCSSFLVHTQRLTTFTTLFLFTSCTSQA